MINNKELISNAESQASQTIRKTGPEVDPLWLGAGRTLEDLEKPQVLLETTFGDSHPGSRHLNQLAQSVSNAIYASQAFPANYTVTDICDGVATGHPGMSYSLVSRDLIAAMTEVHARAAAYDALVTISSCDKATPGHLMAIARLDIPAVHVPGGSMMPGPAFISGDTCYEADTAVLEGRMTKAEAVYYKLNSCPSCGACQYIGTASTMQALSEALGLTMPGNALAPANSNYILHYAAEAAKTAVRNIHLGLKPSDILTKEAFGNAIRVHAAIGGSSNAVLHLPAIAAELGINLDLNDFKNLTKGIPLLTGLLTAGKWPTQYFWMAGGIPAIEKELIQNNLLDSKLPTVTGKTVGENLEMLEKQGFFRRVEEFMSNLNMKTSDIIKSVDKPENEDSGVSILKGNIAPDGAVLKHYALDKSMHHFIGRARVFDSEFEATNAIYKDDIHPGDVVIIRYCGQHALGMPEMAKAINAICNKPELSLSTAIITDGRFSGGSRGPCIGYLLPEATDGGPIGLVKENDLIEIDVASRGLNVIGINGQTMSKNDIADVLQKRAENYTPRRFKHKGAIRYITEN